MPRLSCSVTVPLANFAILTSFRTLSARKLPARCNLSGIGLRLRLWTSRRPTRPGCRESPPHAGRWSGSRCILLFLIENCPVPIVYIAAGRIRTADDRNKHKYRTRYIGCVFLCASLCVVRRLMPLLAGRTKPIHYIIAFPIVVSSIWTKTYQLPLFFRLAHQENRHAPCVTVHAG